MSEWVLFFFTHKQAPPGASNTRRGPNPETPEEGIMAKEIVMSQALLDKTEAFRNPEGPNSERQSVAFTLPNGVKRAGFCVSAITNWRNNVQYPRGLAATLRPGSVVSPFLFFNPQNSEVHYV